MDGQLSTIIRKQQPPLTIKGGNSDNQPPSLHRRKRQRRIKYRVDLLYDLA
jgi:hypothetical protein